MLFVYVRCYVHVGSDSGSGKKRGAKAAASPEVANSKSKKQKVSHGEFEGSSSSTESKGRKAPKHNSPGIFFVFFMSSILVFKNQNTPHEKLDVFAEYFSS